MSRRPLVPAASIVAALILALAVTGAAQAATITACVKKTTGAVTIVAGKKAKKKCPKGSTKVRWSTTGTRGKPGARGPAGTPGVTGPAGVAGPPLFVRDKNGASLGQFMGSVPSPLPYMGVLRDGGLFYYLGTGQLLPMESPKFKTSACTLTAAYISTSSALEAALLTGSAGGPGRIVYRTTSPAWGPAAAWKFTATTEVAAAAQLYALDSGGVCAASGGPFNGTLIALEPTSAPADALGPLTIAP